MAARCVQCAELVSREPYEDERALAEFPCDGCDGYLCADCSMEQGGICSECKPILEAP